MAAFKSHVFLLYVCLLNHFQLFVPGNATSNEILELDALKLEELSRDHAYVVILFYEGDCINCNNYVSELVKVSIPTLPDLKVGKTKDKSLTQKFGVYELPCIIYYRKGDPILYDGEVIADELSIWLEAAQEVSTQSLNTDSFEHLTQAATGATTGDWFVVFYKPSCDHVLSTVDTVAFRMKQRMNVAKVNLEESPSLGKRFKIDACPTGVLFRHSKMYRFPQEKFTVRGLTLFLESWYKNVAAETVKPEPSPFDVLVENIVDQLKIYLEGPHRTKILIAASTAAILLTALLAWCCCCSRGSTSGHIKAD